ncbi:fibronectin type III domain-containing protein [Streptomyces sp. NPDC096079]|uniref:fibronectin type III domain-containing protein n=1 Tax=Streptomyces sp. NPDC096079 TaxID=3155820 RepID=UPI00332FCC87
MNALQGEVQLPGVGGVDKKVLIGVGALAAVFVGWRYYQARQGAAAEEPTDPGFEDGGTLPGVSGAVRDGNDYGLPEGDGSGSGGGSVDDYGFHGTTNSQWTQYVAAKLSQDDKWSYATILAALGQYLADKPLTKAQIEIVQAAFAVGGNPPVGYHSVIPGGDVAVIVAPGGLIGVPGSDTAVSLRWNAVAGVTGYRVYRNGTEAMSTSGPSASVTGLSPATSYSFAVAAVSSGGQVGPKSATVSVRTMAKKTPSAPPTAPKPTGKTPAVTAKKYPTRWKTVMHRPGDNYSKIAARNGLHISGTDLYNYQFSSQAGRPASTKSTLKSRGPNKIYAGGTTVLPYPK